MRISRRDLEVWSCHVRSHYEDLVWEASMDEEQATALANALGGETYQSGGGWYVVQIQRSDGKLAVISYEVVCEYESEEAFHGGQEPTQSIYLH